MRVLVGIIAGGAAGIIITSESDQGTDIAILILIGFIFYFISYYLSRRIGREIQKPQRRKLATNGLVPFIFILLMFMIFVYTWLHQDLAH
jgi:membrane protein insertase Oxa1/YidC/SpoIIIJ